MWIHVYGHVSFSMQYSYFTALQDLGLRTVRLMLRALDLPDTHLGAYIPLPIVSWCLHYKWVTGVV